MTEKKNNIEDNLADVVIGRPHGFMIGHKHFCLYPVTLAKKFLLKRQIEELELNQDNLKYNPYLESLRLAKEKRETCCNILAYYTAPNTYKDLYDHRAITIRKNVFLKDLDDEELASLLIIVFTADQTDEFITYLGLDKERERMNKVMEIKNRNRNDITFNGKGIFGAFIGPLKEMGYSDNEILYEKGYSYLRLMLADKITNIFLTEEEKKEIPNEMGGAMVDASNPENTQSIAAMFGNSGLSVQTE